MSGDAGRARGAYNELRLVQLLNEDPKPYWVRGVAKATAGQDRRGLDIAVKTDVGTLFLQVKSSPKEAQIFRKKYRGRSSLGSPPIAVVVVCDWKSPEDIRKQAFSLLMEMREDKANYREKLVYTLPKSWSFLNVYQVPCSSQ